MSIDKFITTRTGKFLLPVNGVYEHPPEVNIQDICFALDNMCRFNGHVNFYSVANHSLLVGALLEFEFNRPDLALEGLLHDAHEAYCGDVTSPVKAMIPEYSSLMEAPIERAVRKHFGLPPCMHPLVKQADLMALAIEKRDLRPDLKDEPWQVLSGIRVPSSSMFSARSMPPGACRDALESSIDFKLNRPDIDVESMSFSVA